MILLLMFLFQKQPIGLLSRWPQPDTAAVRYYHKIPQAGSHLSGLKLYNAGAEKATNLFRHSKHTAADSIKWKQTMTDLGKKYLED